MTEPSDEARRALSQLPLRDQLLHGIGRVAQAQVQVEMALRQLYHWMTLPGPAGYLAASRKGIRPLAEDCRVLVEKSVLSDDVKAAGEEALKDAMKADELRHRVVHDWWVQLMDADDPSAAPFRRLRAAKEALAYHAEPSDLDFVNNAEEQLLRTLVRINSLTFAASQPVFRGASLPGGPTLEQLLADIRGEFTLLPGGGWQPTRPAEAS